MWTCFILPVWRLPGSSLELGTLSSGLSVPTQTHSREDLVVTSRTHWRSQNGEGTAPYTEHSRSRARGRRRGSPSHSLRGSDALLDLTLFDSKRTPANI